MKLRVGVIFGGRSGEHEVSVRSAATVIKQADNAKYSIIPIAITKEGRWLTPADSILLFPSDVQEDHAARFDDLKDIYNGPTSSESLLSPVADLLSDRCLDVVFPVLHGTYGEDGTIQGLLEMAGIPYVGCGVLASSSGMDKAFMKTLFRDAGLPICNYVWFLRDEWQRNQDRTVSQVSSKLGYPCFVKPANLGSSVGVSKATDAGSLAAAIALAAEFDRKIIVEEALEMREIECAVLGNDDVIASQPGEYLIRDESKAFLDYTEKYTGTGNNEFVVPSPVSQELAEKIKQMAITAFKAVDGSGLARVDFFLRKDNGALLVNEINTMPGLTDASGFPKMWASSGKQFSEVIDDLIRLAIERHNDRARNKTSQ